MDLETGLTGEAKPHHPHNMLPNACQPNSSCLCKQMSLMNKHNNKLGRGAASFTLTN